MLVAWRSCYVNIEERPPAQCRSAAVDDTCRLLSEEQRRPRRQRRVVDEIRPCSAQQQAEDRTLSTPVALPLVSP